MVQFQPMFTYCLEHVSGLDVMNDKCMYFQLYNKKRCNFYLCKALQYSLGHFKCFLI